MFSDEKHQKRAPVTLFCCIFQNNERGITV